MRYWDVGSCETLGGRTLCDIRMEDTVRHWDGGHCESLGWRTL